MQSGC